MKKAISVSEDKLAALEMYLGQRSTTLEAELTKYTEQLYLKTVPQNVRNYIEMTTARKPARKAKVASDTNPEDEQQ